MGDGEGLVWGVYICDIKGSRILANDKVLTDNGGTEEV